MQFSIFPDDHIIRIKSERVITFLRCFKEINSHNKPEHASVRLFSREIIHRRTFIITFNDFYRSPELNDAMRSRMNPTKLNSVDL